jgi:hypothetical protein
MSDHSRFGLLLLGLDRLDLVGVCMHVPGLGTLTCYVIEFLA